MKATAMAGRVVSRIDEPYPISKVSTGSNCALYLAQNREFVSGQECEQAAHHVQRHQIFAASNSGGSHGSKQERQSNGCKNQPNPEALAFQ